MLLVSEQGLLACIAVMYFTAVALAAFGLRGAGWRRIWFLAVLISFGAGIRRAVLLFMDVRLGHVQTENMSGELLSLLILAMTLNVGVVMLYFMFRSLERSHEALRESEETFRGMVGHLSGVVFRCLNDDSWTMLYISDMIETLTGHPASDFTRAGGRSFASLIVPEDRAAVRALRTDIMRGETFELTYRLRHASGEILWVSEKGCGVYDEDGNLLWLVGYIHDTSRERKSQQLLCAQRDLALALSHSRGLEETLGLCLDTAIAAADMDAGGVYLAAPETGALRLVCHRGLSEDFAHQAGHYAPDSVNAKLVWQGAPIYARYDEILRTDAPILRQEGLKAIGIIPITYDNQVIACLNIASHALDHMPMFARQVLETLAGQIGQAIAREQAEALRIEREANLNTLFNTIKDMLFVMDKHGCIMRVNPAVVKALGYTEDEMLGAPLLNAHPPEQREEAARMLAEIISGQRATYNIPAVTKDGREIPVETSVTSGRWNGRVAFFGVARDVSERMEAEERRLALERQVQHAQKFESLGILAGGIAHDFNNLLMVILGYVELMQYRLDDKEFAGESLKKIQRTARNASALCKQMLAYSGRGALIKETICLNTLILEMDHLFHASISKKITLTMRLGEALPAIVGDPAQLQQVMMNLVFNAAEAIGDEEGVITITTRVAEFTEEARRELGLAQDDAHCIMLEVADTGCGMDAETLERVYDPFFSTKFTGRGLGMSAVLGIVRGLRGSIKGKSAPGQGTTFRILLPPAQEPAQPKIEAPEKQPVPMKGDGTILIVEDEDDLREMGKMTGEFLGFRMLSAADGCEAVEIYSRERDSIDLVLLDMTMPRMDGEQAFYEMKRLNPRVRVIITSGYANQEIEKRFAGQGLIGVLQKPYSMSALEEKIQQAFKHTG